MEVGLLNITLEQKEDGKILENDSGSEESYLIPSHTRDYHTYSNFMEDFQRLHNHAIYLI